MQLPSRRQALAIYAGLATVNLRQVCPGSGLSGILRPFSGKFSFLEDSCRDAIANALVQHVQAKGLACGKK